jgi:hypothetical protein
LLHPCPQKKVCIWSIRLCKICGNSTLSLIQICIIALPFAARLRETQQQPH